MNILYYGMLGTAANPTLGWPLILISAVVMIVGFFLVARFCANDNWITLMVIPLACLIIGIFNLIDDRKPIVKATLDDTASFAEITKEYKYLKNEGDIYIFEPLNVNIDEWEQQYGNEN